MKLVRPCTDCLNEFYVYKAMLKSYLPGFEETEENYSSSVSARYIKEQIKPTVTSQAPYTLRFTISVMANSTPSIDIYVSKFRYRSPEELKQENDAIEAISRQDRERKAAEDAEAQERKRKNALEEYKRDLEVLDVTLVKIIELDKKISQEIARYGDKAYTITWERELLSQSQIAYDKVNEMIRDYEGLIPQEAIDALQENRSSLRINLGMDGGDDY